MGVKKAWTEDIISFNKSRPDKEEGVKNPSKDNLKSSDTSNGSKASSATQLKVRIQNSHYVDCMGQWLTKWGVYRTHTALYGSIRLTKWGHHPYRAVWV